MGKRRTINHIAGAYFIAELIESRDPLTSQTLGLESCITITPSGSPASHVKIHNADCGPRRCNTCSSPNCARVFCVNGLNSLLKKKKGDVDSAKAGTAKLANGVIALRYCEKREAYYAIWHDRGCVKIPRKQWKHVCPCCHSAELEECFLGFQFSYYIDPVAMYMCRKCRELLLVGELGFLRIERTENVLVIEKARIRRDNDGMNVITRITQVRLPDRDYELFWDFYVDLRELIDDYKEEIFRKLMYGK